MHYRNSLHKVLGELNGRIQGKKPNAPTMSAIVVNGTSKLPGPGIEGFPGFEDWSGADEKQKRKIAATAQEKVFSYPHWSEVYESLFGKKPPSIKNETYRERDGNVAQGVHGFGGESREHKTLKEFIAKNPKKLKIEKSAQCEKEFSLPSGDRVDVVFVGSNGTTLIEAKSRLSSDDDLKRGIYQCVKYRAVYCAWRCDLLDVSKNSTRKFARVILATERALPSELVELTKVLKVEHRQIIRSVPR